MSITKTIRADVVVIENAPFYLFPKQIHLISYFTNCYLHSYLSVCMIKKRESKSNLHIFIYLNSLQPNAQRIVQISFPIISVLYIKPLYKIKKIIFFSAFSWFYQEEEFENIKFVLLGIFGGRIFVELELLG